MFPCFFFFVSFHMTIWQLFFWNHFHFFLFNYLDIKSVPTSQRYQTVYSGMNLTAQPLEVQIISGNKLVATVSCARICGHTTRCNVFSVSFGSHECRLYMFVELCNIQVDPYTSVYKLVWKLILNLLNFDVNIFLYGYFVI